MIHHVSIAAENPQNAAKVLAEILHGKTKAFPYFPNSYFVFAGDECGTEIVVFPLGIELTIDRETGYEFTENATPSRFTATHINLSVPASFGEIEQIAAREGWLVRRSNFGFDFIEFWLENRICLELMTPDMVPPYLAYVNLQAGKNC